MTEAMSDEAQFGFRVPPPTLDFITLEIEKAREAFFKKYPDVPRAAYHFTAVRRDM